MLCWLIYSFLCTYNKRDTCLQVPRLDLSVLKELIEAGTCVRFG